MAPGVVAENQGVLLVRHESGLMDDESKVHTRLKMTRHRAAHLGVTYRKPLGSAKATDPKELQLRALLEVLIVAVPGETDVPSPTSRNDTCFRIHKKVATSRFLCGAAALLMPSPEWPCGASAEVSSPKEQQWPFQWFQ